MPALIWPAGARRDLSAIVSYTAERDPAAARRLKGSIERAYRSSNTLLRPGRVLGTRELVAHPNTIIVYRVAANSVEIISVVHAR